LYGFTATPNRADGIGLESVFDEIIFKKDLRYGIENGYLSPIWCRKINIGYDLSQVAVRMGDYAPGDLERAVNVDKCNDALAEIVSGIAELPCLIFAVDVAHAEAIAEAINKHCGNIARALNANSPDRNEVVEAYKRGEIDVIVNCALFTEGTDLPNTRTVIIARPTKSV
jgi:superfamily II DNA or RNA helicase